MKLFEIVDESAKLLNENIEIYKEVEKNIVDFLVSTVVDSEIYIGYTSRVKTAESFKNKIVRKKYYLKHDSGQAILDDMNDIIGITLECRFKEDEIRLLNKVKEGFLLNGEQYSQAITSPSIYMDFKMPQPQKQNNGFDNFRVDGYTYSNGHKIKFELQIKSLINTFWSGIEHEVIYKNNNYLLFDDFLKKMMFSIKANLEIVDYQLTEIYEQMTNNDQNTIGLDDKNFKSFMGKSINDLFSLKLKETINIEANIKKISALISQYIYIQDFIRAEHPQVVMISYIEQLNLLSQSEMDFKKSISIKDKIDSNDSFTNIFGNYCINIMNVDFDWHLLFSMLFILKNDDEIIIFNDFVKFIKDILFSPLWFKEKLDQLNYNVETNGLDEELYKTVAESLISKGSVEILYEENLYDVMILIRKTVNDLIIESENNLESFKDEKTKLLRNLKESIVRLIN